MTENVVGPPRALALVSGSLDSLLAARLAARAGFEVRALWCNTGFDRPDYARRATAAGDPWCVEEVDVFDAIAGEVLPQLNRGTPGVRDAAVWRLRQVVLLGCARRVAGSDEVTLVTGDVVGQRRHGATRDDLGWIDDRAGVRGRVLRPLCAGLLAPLATNPAGGVTRDEGLAIHGRSRREQLALADSLGIAGAPTSSGRSWRLDDPRFARRVADRLAGDPAPLARDEAAILAMGRHFGLGSGVRAVVGRNADECAELERLAGFRTTCRAADGRGPLVVVVGSPGGGARRDAAMLAARYGKRGAGAAMGDEIVVRGPRGEERLTVEPASDEDLARWRL